MAMKPLFTLILSLACCFAFGQSADWTRNTVSLWPRFASNIFNISLTNGVTINGTNVSTSELFRVQNQGTNQFRVDRNSGYTGSGTNFLSDDGTFKAVSSGASVNPTSGYIPYNNAGTFADSPLYRVGGSSIGITTTTNILTASGKVLSYTNSSTSIQFRVQDGAGTIAQLGTTTGGHLLLLGGTGSAVYIGQNNNGSGDWIIDPNLSPTANNSRDVGSSTVKVRSVYVGTSVVWTNSVADLFGYGSPEGVLSYSVGSTYRRLDGGAGTTWYVKESGTGNTGWVAK